jgi:hypothetical protein
VRFSQRRVHQRSSVTSQKTGVFLRIVEVQGEALDDVESGSACNEDYELENKYRR